MRANFRQLSQEEITRFVGRLGQKPYRARQIINWIYDKFATSFDDMSDLSRNFRQELKEKAYISNLNLLQRQISEDGTQKFLFELEDGETIESVLIPNSKGKEKFTLCISSQVGCAMGCIFCMTGKLGLKRNLRDYEIVDQVIAVKRYMESKSIELTPSITNIVFMGMGEPLRNFHEVIRALWKITGLMGFSKRKITISTAGIIPKIYELSDKAPEVNLAISLNATTDRIRNKIMPVNKKYPLKKIINACKEFPLSPHRRITFEYVLLDAVNDAKEDALRLVKLLRGIKSKVNLIPYNPIRDSMSSPSFKRLVPKYQDRQSNIELRQPVEADILEFQRILQKAGIIAVIRKSKGEDISAACGQLSGIV